MARSPARITGTTVENNFSKGLITEASGLNFPENASTETWNCIFRETGQVRRRLGLDWEAEYDLGTAVDDVELTGAVVEYIWKAVSTVGILTFVVVQLGNKITFYTQTSTSGGAVGLSAGQKGFTIDLADYSTIAASQLRNIACSFASGDGYLFITHPRILPLVVSFDNPTNSITVTQIDIGIRDFEGVNDALGIGEQPDTLSNLHWYNLKNQGWWKDVLCVDQGGGVSSVLPNDIPDETSEYYFPVFLSETTIAGGDEGGGGGGDDNLYLFIWGRVTITGTGTGSGAFSGDITASWDEGNALGADNILIAGPIPIGSGSYTTDYTLAADADSGSDVRTEFAMYLCDTDTVTDEDTMGLNALDFVGDAAAGVPSAGTVVIDGTEATLTLTLTP